MLENQIVGIPFIGINSSSAYGLGNPAASTTPYFGSLDDLITLKSGNNTIFAGEGNNQITSGAGNDIINAGSGRDLIIPRPNSKEINEDTITN